MAKKVSQSELRTLMSKLRTDKGAKNSKQIKKYKLGNKELALIEEEKKRKAEADRNEENEQRRKVARTAGVPENFFDAAKTKAYLSLNKAPAKSILKNRPAAPPAAASPKATGKEWTSSAPTTSSSSLKQSFKTPGGGAIHHLEEENRVPVDFFDAKSAPVEEGPAAGPSAEEDTSLPEGFFDDPIMDAKARGIEYKNPEDEEWEAFKKEIAVEVAVSQDIQAEDELEETTERQLEEIDDQMRAWNRVRDIEIRKDVVDEKIEKTRKQQVRDEPEPMSEDEDEDMAEVDEFLDWRLKKAVR